ncbi:MAG: hypothetical protein V8S72_04390 [Oscillospiraceae bacterium]
MEKGATLPNARQFLAICDVLGIEDIRGTFSGTGGELLAGLNREGRGRALEYIQLLRESGRFRMRSRVRRRSRSPCGCGRCRCIRWPCRQAPAITSTARITRW